MVEAILLTALPKDATSEFTGLASHSWMRKRLIFEEAEAQPKKVQLPLPSFLKN